MWEALSTCPSQQHAGGRKNRMTLLRLQCGIYCAAALRAFRVAVTAQLRTSGQCDYMPICIVPHCYLNILTLPLNAALPQAEPVNDGTGSMCRSCISLDRSGTIHED